MIFGLLKPDAGEMSWEGETVQVASPAQARALGVGMVGTLQSSSYAESLLSEDRLIRRRDQKTVMFPKASMGSDPGF